MDPSWISLSHGRAQVFPVSGSAAMQGLLGAGVGGEDNYTHTFKIAYKTKRFGTTAIEKQSNKF